ncbi:MAG: hypothetical protein H8E53_09180 [Planctomycetes bacterium]|nr:hypothetical protein [Planctomycetota bacterium]
MESDGNILKGGEFKLDSGKVLGTMRYLRKKTALTAIWFQPSVEMPLTFVFPIPIGLKKAELQFYDVEPIMIDLPQ